MCYVYNQWYDISCATLYYQIMYYNNTPKAKEYRRKL